jgi:hypothetical protein
MRRETKDLAESVALVGKHAMGLAKTLRERAEEEGKLAGKSLVVSLTGLGLILFGFALQTVGSWPCN